MQKYVRNFSQIYACIDASGKAPSFNVLPSVGLAVDAWTLKIAPANCNPQWRARTFFCGASVRHLQRRWESLTYHCVQKLWGQWTSRRVPNGSHHGDGMSLVWLGATRLHCSRFTPFFRSQAITWLYGLAWNYVPLFLICITICALAFARVIKTVDHVYLSLLAACCLAISQMTNDLFGIGCSASEVILHNVHITSVMSIMGVLLNAYFTFCVDCQFLLCSLNLRLSSFCCSSTTKLCHDTSLTFLRISRTSWCICFNITGSCGRPGIY